MMISWPGKAVSGAVKTVLSQGTELPESLDPALLEDYHLMPLMDAVRIIHFPESKEELLPARRRLVFEEFYRFIVNVRRMKEDTEKEKPVEDKTPKGVPNLLLFRMLL